MQDPSQFNLDELRSRIRQVNDRESFREIVQQIEKITNCRDYSWVKKLNIGDELYMNHAGLSDPDFLPIPMFHNCTAIRLVKTPDEFLDKPQINLNELFDSNNGGAKFSAGTGFIFSITHNTQYQRLIYQRKIPLVDEESIVIFWKDPRVIEDIKIELTKRNNGEEPTQEEVKKLVITEVKKFNIKKQNDQNDWYFLTRKPLYYNPEDNKFKELDT